MKPASAVIACLALLAACASAHEAAGEKPLAPPRASDLAELAWISPDVDRVKALTERPPECLGAVRPTNEPDENRRRLIQRLLGRIAFESPALLGGAAARGGISCSSCHVNGRGNPNFFVNGVSGAPGTADVTSSLFSKSRGDGQFNPVPIPDLAMRDGTQMKDRTTPEFRAKVRGLIVEEFDGQEPPAEVFEALLVYLDSLKPEACPSDPAPVRPQAAGDFMAFLLAASAVNEPAYSVDARVFWLRSSRLILGRIDERLADPQDADLRAVLREASEVIAGHAEDLRLGRPPTSPRLRHGPLSSEAIREAEPRSLYNPDVLAKALAKERAAEAGAKSK